MATESGNLCWFCDVRTADDTVAVPVKLYGNVRSESQSFGATRLTWDKEVIRVPCCLNCERQATKKINAQNVGAGTGAVVAFGAFFFLRHVAGMSVALCLLVAALVFGFALLGTWIVSRALVANDLRSAKNPGDYPTVVEKLGDGWSLGEEPPEAVRLGE